jgi:hypothetical protein
MEEQLSQKMTEFLAVIDQVKKYRALLYALPDIAIIVCLAFVGAFAADVWGHLSEVFSSPTFMVTNLLSILFVAGGLAAAVFWGYRKMKKTIVGEWKPTLNEGAPGAIKLLENMNWADTFKGIRHAKLGFWLFGVLRTVIAWILAFFAMFFAINALGPVVYMRVDLQLIALFALALVLALSVNDFKKRFDQIGRLDALLWELRWMDHDFRRNPFQT